MVLGVFFKEDNLPLEQNGKERFDNFVGPLLVWRPESPTNGDQSVIVNKPSLLSNYSSRLFVTLKTSVALFHLRGGPPIDQSEERRCSQVELWIPFNILIHLVVDGQ